MKFLVRNGDLNQALKVLKRKLQEEGVFREMRTRESYEKPSDKQRREKGEAVRRKKKEARKLQAAEKLGR